MLLISGMELTAPGGEWHLELERQIGSSMAACSPSEGTFPACPPLKLEINQSDLKDLIDEDIVFCGYSAAYDLALIAVTPRKEAPASCAYDFDGYFNLSESDRSSLEYGQLAFIAFHPGEGSRTAALVLPTGGDVVRSPSVIPLRLLMEIYERAHAFIYEIDNG